MPLPDEPLRALPRGDAAASAARWSGHFRPFLLWLLISAMFIGFHHRAYFQQPFYEAGDFAANALQIRNAKNFREIHGNYSRFQFNHPGPAFFYAYAAGEWLLYNRLRLAPAPYNAHAIIGVLVQVLFFVWAVAILQQRVRRRLLVPCLLLFAAIHFGAVNYYLLNTAFQSIWPPHVLLLPFLCFLVAGASVASGEPRHLVPLVLSGSLLVHGHVAQPLFVGPLTVLAYVSLCFSRRVEGRSRYGWPFFAAPTVHLVAAAIIALFALPLVIDAFRGSESNLNRIVNHFLAGAADRKTWLQSVLYFFTFFFHVVDPEKFCDEPSNSYFIIIKDRWFFLLIWMVVAGAALGLWIANVRRKTFESASFVRWLAIYFAAAVALTLVWGRAQNEQMWEFNSHFNFSILFLLYVLLAIGVASLPRLGNGEFRAGTIFGISLPLLAFASYNMRFEGDPLVATPESAERQAQIVKAVREDRKRSRTKYLTFDDWGEAARVALALKRRGYNFAVPPGWAFLFGRGSGVDPDAALQSGRVSVWKVRAGSVGERWLSTTAIAVGPAGGEIRFHGSENNAADFLPTGWDLSDGPYSWSVGAAAALWLAPQRSESDVEIALELSPFGDAQRVTIAFGDEVFSSYNVVTSTTITLRVPAHVWNKGPYARLTFEFPDAVSQLTLGVSSDARQLGCAFTRITFNAVPEPSSQDQ